MQLLGSHDLSVKDEEGELRREERTRHVLEPFRRCCVAHAGSLLPAALLFFCCDYGAGAAGMARGLVAEVRRRDPAAMAGMLVSALQFAFAAYKTRRAVWLGEGGDGDGHENDENGENDENDENGENGENDENDDGYKNGYKDGHENGDGYMDGHKDRKDGHRDTMDGHGDDEVNNDITLKDPSKDTQKNIRKDTENTQKDSQNSQRDTTENPHNPHTESQRTHHPSHTHHQATHTTPDASQEVEYAHLQGVSRRIASYLGVRLSYPVLVAVFERLRVATCLSLHSRRPSQTCRGRRCWSSPP